MAITKTTKQLGQYTSIILNALFDNKELVEMLIGSCENKTAVQIRKEFKEHVKTHLFIDETIEKTWDYIFFDIYVPRVRNRIKFPLIKLICISHRDMLDDYDSPLDENGEPLFYGNRSKVILQMIEDSLVNNSDLSEKIGIGPLDFTKISLYNGNHYYGYIADFEVSEFR